MAGLVASEQELMTAVQGSLKRLSRKGLYQVFESWKKRCDTCITKEKTYVEKYGSKNNFFVGISCGL